MDIYEECKDLIGVFEGLRLKAYKCPSGKWSIGYGHTKGVKSGMQITIEEAFKFLREDIKEASDWIDEHVKVPLNKNQKVALVSWVFNVGVNAAAKSTLLRILNSGDYEGVPEQLSRWVYGTVDGKKTKLPGLEKRRKAEGELWIRPVC